jgi:hypothetical protein
MYRTFVKATLLLLLTASCTQSPTVEIPTEAQLVQACWDRGGTPNIRGEFKCEAEPLGRLKPDASKVRSARHKAVIATLTKR